MLVLLRSLWASYQIRKIAGCACAGNAGNVFPCRQFQRKPLVSDPGMHHSTCVPHVPWCMSGSLTCGNGGKRSRHSRRMRTRNFAYLARGPLPEPVLTPLYLGTSEQTSVKLQSKHAMTETNVHLFSVGQISMILKLNHKTFFEYASFGDVVCKMSAILLRNRCVYFIFYFQFPLSHQFL